MISTERLAGVFVEVADTLVADFDLIDFLHNLADHAVHVSGASSVGILLADHNDHLQFMAASSEAAEHLELLQIQHSEGPCFDCFHDAEPVIVADLGAATGTWPNFARLATAAGVHSVHAFPLRLRDRVIGAMNVFGQTPLPLDPGDAKVVQALADVATISIIQERAIAQAELLTEQLQGALNSRIVIEQAKGIVARTHRISVDAAFQLLRSHARGNRLRLGTLAYDVVMGSAEIPAPDGTDQT